MLADSFATWAPGATITLFQRMADTSARAGYRTVTVTFRHRSVQQIHRAVIVLTPLSP